MVLPCDLLKRRYEEGATNCGTRMAGSRGGAAGAVVIEGEAAAGDFASDDSAWAGEEAREASAGG